MENLNVNEVDSIKGKVIIVTGANSGVGFEIASILTCMGAKVIIACRNEIDGREVQNYIKGSSEYINLDLERFASIEKFSQVVGRKYSKVDILINNAGVMFPPFTKTHEGLELTFGVNYIGYYFLTNKIMPMLRDVKRSRVVNMSSIIHHRVKNIYWENINSQIYYSRSKTYALSNLFRIMFTLELEEKLRRKNYETIAVSCHPGVTFTNLYRYIPRVFRNTLLAKVMNRTIFQTPYKAAMPALIAVASSDVKGGDFVGLDSKNQFKGNPKIVQPNEIAFNEHLREKLWSESIKITGVDLE
jgi:NAD(P)-dependent dehydrogenase (short-subunit alcohol dehydrogenase family)